MLQRFADHIQLGVMHWQEDVGHGCAGGVEQQHL